MQLLAQRFGSPTDFIEPFDDVLQVDVLAMEFKLPLLATLARVAIDHHEHPVAVDLVAAGRELRKIGIAAVFKRRPKTGMHGVIKFRVIEDVVDQDRTFFF